MTEAEAYRLAHEEIKQKNVHQDTWIKAFAHGNGDERSTVAKYVLFRAELIIKEERELEAARLRAMAIDKWAQQQEKITAFFNGAKTLLFAGIFLCFGFGVLIMASSALMISNEKNPDYATMIGCLVMAFVCFVGAYKLRWAWRDLSKMLNL